MTNFINYWFNHCGSAGLLPLWRWQVPKRQLWPQNYGCWGTCISEHAQCLPGFHCFPSFEDPTLGNLFRILNIRIVDCHILEFKILCFGKIFLQGWSERHHVSQTTLRFTALCTYYLIRASQSPREMGKAGFWAHLITEETETKRS